MNKSHSMNRVYDDCVRGNVNSKLRWKHKTIKNKKDLDIVVMRVGQSSVLTSTEYTSCK